jgi:hypothetical protein
VSDFALWKARVKGWLPGTPGLYAEEIARRLAERQVPPGREHHAIEDMACAVIRHQLTDYDSLWSRHELTPEEAEQIVEVEVEDWLAQWKG